MLHLAKMVFNNEDALKEGEDLRGQSDTIKKNNMSVLLVYWKSCKRN